MKDIYIPDKAMDKLLKSVGENTIYCKNCGHSVVIPKADRTICRWCGNWVYRTPQIEFKYKLMKKIKESK